jgi:hypothetical protein
MKIRNRQCGLPVSNIIVKNEIGKYLTVCVMLAIVGVKLECIGYADTKYAASCSYADVSTAAASASPGDDVMIPNCSAIWDNQLYLTKGINLIGAGIGKTNIVSAFNGAYLVSYAPVDYSANWPMRISGISFDLNYKSGGLILNYSDSDPTIQNKIRIDHNEFKNSTDSEIVLMINGYRGVADNNIFTGTAYPIRFASGPSQMWWNKWQGIVYGGRDNNFYFEDNVFQIQEILVDCQFGNRYAFRYNTITTMTPDGSYPLMDMHGNQGHLWACFGGEIYGNDIYVQGSGGQILDQRGGKAVVYYNKINGDNIGIKMREEYCDNLNRTTNSQPQHVSDSYNWANWKTSSNELVTAYENDNLCGSYKIKENVDWWSQKTNFDGSTGVGCGTLDGRPSTCTPGVGYWATNQSCSDLSGMVGAKPATPISGTLFKCIAPNKWADYYSPLQYPHPLRMPLPAPFLQPIITH